MSKEFGCENFKGKVRYVMSRKEARNVFDRLLKALSENRFQQINEKDAAGCTILHRAAQVSEPEVIKLLIEKGAGTNDRNNRGETPLHLAAFLGRRKNVKVLIEGGATVNAKSNNKAVPLHLACLARRIGTIEELINAGGDLDTVDKFGCSPLNYAKIYPKVTSYLEKKGVNMRDVEVMYGEANKAIEEIMEKRNVNELQQQEVDLTD
ncbi:ankyrin repeat domain-containing protein [Wolbachia endosymbiont (group A) of Andrena hattorfiana]|uniref:ankyrin repeat domain-containing protein n=1 Tax=Wolbachia endosymbiont (group A) of Andrena hattorfiana TaxID=2953977 RepID=UPI0021F8CA01|nr:ankyrin repeat domain-containing protein [Wolbachia endosymbiont (group A) of Andrena hattorfiana]